MSMIDKEISDWEIEKAEKMLLPEDEKFDISRRNVIKCLETKDIKACPGSGKTTALLAKLLILADRMPFANGRGICVLTHTNVAIDEIKEKLGVECAVLFQYPNFFGTFQSFVDKFLAIPGYCEKFNHRNIRIDNVLYETYMKKIFYSNRLQYDGWLLQRIQHQDKSKEEKAMEMLEYFMGIGFLFENDGIISLKDRKHTKILDGKNASPTYQKLFNLKNQLLKKGILCYDDAYSLACYYIQKHGSLKKAFSTRFKYVFIDEMQDTNKLQSDILENIFDENVIMQKYGDLHQAIYDEQGLEESDVWNINEDFLPLAQTKRFGTTIAKLVSNLCAEKDYVVEGNDNVLSHPPHIVLYNDNTIEDVLERFANLIRKYNLHKFSPNEKVRPFKAIGWISKKNKGNPKRLCVQDYFTKYCKETNGKKSYFNNLKSYLQKQPQNIVRKTGAKCYYERIIHVFVHVLNMTGIKAADDRYFTAALFEEKLKEEHGDEYIALRKKIGSWILQINNNAVEHVYEEIKIYIKEKLKTIFPNFSNNTDLEVFMEDAFEQELEKENILGENIYISDCVHDSIKIHVGTVHSVKGETHRATLYLETSYYANASMDGHESERILDFMKGKYSKPLVGKARHLKTLKIAYVGMSRPTHLLCVAVHVDRLKEQLDELKKAGWEVDDELINMQ